MSKLVKFILVFFFLLCISANAEAKNAYLFSYASDSGRGGNGLNFAWSSDGRSWDIIGAPYVFLKCDYGRWGSEKKMIDPYLFRGNDGLWHCVWTLNQSVGAFAHASSPDLVNWNRQSYPLMMTSGGNCTQLFVKTEGNRYAVYWTSSKSSASGNVWKTTSSDMKNYSGAEPSASPDPAFGRTDIMLGGKTQTGTIHEVPVEVISALERACALAAEKQRLYSQTLADYAQSRTWLQPVEIEVRAEAHRAKNISDMLIGVFYEDINYAADGGLYAELIRNRDFEFAPSDREGDRNWNSLTAWSLKDEKGSVEIRTENPIHPNNPNYAVLSGGACLVNEGFDGIAVKTGEKYDFSIFTRLLKGSGMVNISLRDSRGDVVASSVIDAGGREWKKHPVVMTALRSEPDARIEISTDLDAVVAVDMISLFPQNTFKGRKNGLRADIAQAIADIHPRFVRFPGGCVAHGDGIENIYRWKHTVGPVESRVPNRNIWGYHQTAGLGYFEYFQFCEDIGAQPVPIVAAGVPCQNSATHGHPLGGQQGGIPLEEMDAYIQDVLDLVEWANGSVNTTWGRIRAEAGHPEPFNLKYIGVGNEDLISDVFEERFKMIFEALKKHHPEITVISTAGPFYEGTDYREGWALGRKLGVPMLDEHYYVSPGWMIHNQNFYDSYDRNGPKVYLGEYAAHVAGRKRNLETALSEALYLTSVERNADVVSMTSYAPLLANEKHTQWNPNLIYFNNSEVKPSTGYYVQKLFGNHSGEQFIPAQITVKGENTTEDSKRIGISVVRSKGRGELVIKLVNALPVPVDADIDLKGLIRTAQTAANIVLVGELSDEDLRPRESQIAVRPDFKYRLPAFSFSVIVLKVD